MWLVKNGCKVHFDDRQSRELVPNLCSRSLLPLEWIGSGPVACLLKGWGSSKILVTDTENNLPVSHLVFWTFCVITLVPVVYQGTLFCVCQTFIALGLLNWIKKNSIKACHGSICPLLVSYDHIHGVMALTLFEDFVYWTDGKSKSLRRAHKTTGAQGIELLNSWQAIKSIKVYHSLRQPEGIMSICTSCPFCPPMLSSCMGLLYSVKLFMLPPSVLLNST